MLRQHFHSSDIISCCIAHGNFIIAQLLHILRLRESYKRFAAFYFCCYFCVCCKGRCTTFSFFCCILEFAFNVACHIYRPAFSNGYTSIVEGFRWDKIRSGIAPVRVHCHAVKFHTVTKDFHKVALRDRNFKGCHLSCISVHLKIVTTVNFDVTHGACI